MVRQPNPNHPGPRRASRRRVLGSFSSLVLALGAVPAGAASPTYWVGAPDCGDALPGAGVPYSDAYLEDCPPGGAATRPGAGAATGEPSPSDMTDEGDWRSDPDAPLADFAPGDSEPAFDSGMPSGLGAVAAADSPSVHMIGDFFGSGNFLVSGSSAATVPAAGGDRRFKATDNFSPLPQDRVFFNYHHFHNAVYDVAGASRSVDRYTLGLEHSCLDGAVSLEVRIPFLSGLNSTQSFSNTTTTSEFGNVSLTAKARLIQCGGVTFVSGLATVLPTADDAAVVSDSGGTMLENQAVHLQPYFGATCQAPNDRLFSTAYIAFDFDANGNDVFESSSDGTFFIGNVHDQTLLFADLQVGYWCYQDYGHIGYLNAIAPVLELHYSRTLDSPETLPGYFENPYGTADLLNLTAGLVFDFRRSAMVTVYGAAPLIRDEVQYQGRTVSPVFQSEFGVQCVYRY